MSRAFAIAGIAALTTTAAIVIAQPSGNESAIDGARPGATIRLPAATGQVLKIFRKQYSPAITIDASNAVLSGIVIRGSSGVHIRGGSVIGLGERSYGVHIDGSHDVWIDGMTISGSHRGVVVNRSSDVRIRNNELVGLISDGINLALSQGIVVEGNSCARFRPNLATFDKQGNRIRDGDHPDCIQAWSRPGGIVSDVKVIGNHIKGAMQGIFFGDGVHGGVADGGYDRILIAENIIEISFPRAIALGGARTSMVRNNRVSTIPGAVLPNRPQRAVVAGISVSPGVLACGNLVENARIDTGTRPCQR